MPAARARGPDRSEPVGVCGCEDADAGEPVLEGDVVELELAPAASASVADARRALRGRFGVVCGSRSRRCAPTWTVPKQEAVAGEAVVEPPGAFGERREEVVAGGEADAGADRGDVVEVVPDAFELEQDRAGARELAVGRESERLLAGVRVGERCSRPRRRRRRAAT